MEQIVSSKRDWRSQWCHRGFDLRCTDQTGAPTPRLRLPVQLTAMPSMMERVRSRSNITSPGPTTASGEGSSREQSTRTGPLGMLAHTAGARAGGDGALGGSFAEFEPPLSLGGSPGRARQRSDTVESRDEAYRKRQRFAYAREQCDTNELSALARKDIMEASQVSTFALRC
jgi:hypothetical protein